MRVTVNGEARMIDGTVTVADLASQVLGGAPATTKTANKVPLLTRGVAVAVNGEVVPRSTWVHRALHDGDRVEILTAVQGG
jgi:sulfur carrier protein